MISKIPPVILFLVSLLFAKGLSEDTCGPQCLQPNSYTADPRDCYQYYYCYPDLTPSDTPERCPADTFFADGGCTGTGECPQSSICPACHVTCDASIPHDTIADVLDCSISYSCESGGVGMTFTCPANKPYYDSVTKLCSDDSAVCCSPGCVPHCYGDMTRTADPTDCTRYYTCLDGAVNYLLDCPGGETFDLPSGLCKAGAKCNEWCNSRDVIGRSPFSTTSTASAKLTFTTSTTTTSPGPCDCLPSLLCAEEGFFPKCSGCNPRYFYCPEPGLQGIEEECTSGLVFNPVPGYPYCLAEADCPYLPRE